MRVRHRHNHTPSFILAPLRVTLERNQAAAIVLLARANKGRHLLPRHQAMGTTRVASSDMTMVYCHRVLKCQNGPALCSTNRNMRCRIIDHPRNVQKHKNRAASSEEVGPFPEASPADQLRSRRGCLLLFFFFRGWAFQRPVREDRVPAHLKLS